MTLNSSQALRFILFLCVCVPFLLVELICIHVYFLFSIPQLQYKVYDGRDLSVLFMFTFPGPIAVLDNSYLLRVLRNSFECFPVISS